MKKLILLFLLPTVIVLSSSCSNDIDLTAEWKDIPVVYGLLSTTDTANYIRVEKAFLNPDVSALEIAQQPDSLYYQNATVQIQKIDSSDPPLIFQKVDANQEGYQREDGIFATSPNYVYKMVSNQTLEAGVDYELQINRGDQLPVVTATTTVIPEVDVKAPQDPDDANPFNWGNYDWELSVRWRTKPSAAFFDVVLFLHIDEFDVNEPGSPNRVVLEWQVEKGIPAGNPATNGDISMDIDVDSEDFFPFIGNALEEKNGVFREFKHIDVLVRSGGQEFLDYINIGLVNSGITSSQIIPTYTNLSEGFGIFSSRNEVLLEGYQVTTLTVDSLIDGFYTKDLNFQY